MKILKWILSREKETQLKNFTKENLIKKQMQPECLAGSYDTAG